MLESMVNNCPYKFRKLTNGDTCGSCVLGQRVKFTYYVPKSKPMKVRGHIASIVGELWAAKITSITLKDIKIQRQWRSKKIFKYRFLINRIRFFEFVKLCEEGEKIYPILCQNGIAKRLEGRAVAETTSKPTRNRSSARGFSFLRRKLVLFWHNIKNWINGYGWDEKA